jgi:hypothetical protein
MMEIIQNMWCKGRNGAKHEYTDVSNTKHVDTDFNDAKQGKYW